MALSTFLSQSFKSRQHCLRHWEQLWAFPSWRCQVTRSQGEEMNVIVRMRHITPTLLSSHMTSYWRTCEWNDIKDRAAAKPEETHASAWLQSWEQYGCQQQEVWEGHSTSLSKKKKAMWISKQRHLEDQNYRTSITRKLSARYMQSYLVINRRRLDTRILHAHPEVRKGLCWHLVSHFHQRLPRIDRSDPKTSRCHSS